MAGPIFRDDSLRLNHIRKYKYLNIALVERFVKYHQTKISEMVFHRILKMMHKLAQLLLPVEDELEHGV